MWGEVETGESDMLHGDTVPRFQRYGAIVDLHLRCYTSTSTTGNRRPLHTFARLEPRALMSDT